MARNKLYDWKEGNFKAKINPKANDFDYLRIQNCCTSCGQYIGHLPGYWFIETDCCPDCRGAGEESWRKEVMRLNDDSAEDRKECSKEMKKYGL